MNHHTIKLILFVSVAHLSSFNAWAGETLIISRKLVSVNDEIDLIKWPSQNYPVIHTTWENKIEVIAEIDLKTPLNQINLKSIAENTKAHECTNSVHIDHGRIVVNGGKPIPLANDQAIKIYEAWRYGPYTVILVETKKGRRQMRKIDNRYPSVIALLIESKKGTISAADFGSQFPQIWVINNATPASP